MFEIGDSVVMKSNDKIGGFLVGKIVDWYFDEGNVWVVDFDGTLTDCYDSILSPL